MIGLQHTDHALQAGLGILERAHSVFIATADQEAATIVAQALEREGLVVNDRWGALDELAPPWSQRLDLLIAVEPEDETCVEGEYASARRRAPAAALLVICSAARPRPEELIWAGAEAIIFEPGADAAIGPAARAVLSGYMVVPRGLRANLQPPALTTRERQMLALVVEGLTNREIAERLYLAESTVKRHLSSTFRRLGVRSRREAAAAVIGAQQSFFGGAAITEPADRA
jgi:DNA-binding CsgD family transcriptional regulator